MSKAREENLKELFANGHSPSSALEAIKMDLQIADGENYVFTAADRAKCPDVSFCYRYEKRCSRRTCNVYRNLSFFKLKLNVWGVGICTSFLGKIKKLFMILIYKFEIDLEFRERSTCSRIAFCRPMLVPKSETC